MSNNPQVQMQTSNRQVPTAISVEEEMSLRKLDWKRIYRKVKTIPRPIPLYEMVTAILWGISGSAFLSLIPLYQSTKGTEPWVKPTYWIAAIITAIVGLISFKFISERNKFVGSSCEEVLKDMSDVYHCFFPKENLDEEPAPNNSLKPTKS